MIALTAITGAGDLTAITAMVVIIAGAIIPRRGDGDTAIERRSVSDRISEKAGERSSAFFVGGTGGA